LGEQRKSITKPLLGGEGEWEKTPKNSKKRPKKIPIKALFTISVPCVKIQGDAHGLMLKYK